MYKCGFCTRSYSTYGNLIRHQKSSQECMELRDEKFILIEDEFDCVGCYRIFYQKSNLDKHLPTCIKYQIYITEKKYNLILAEKDKEIFNKDKENIELKIQLKDKDTELKNIIDKAISKPTIINNNNNIVKNEDNRVINVVNFLKEINRPITDQLLADNAQHLTLQHCLRGGEGLALYAMQFPLTEAPLICTDSARKNFKYVDRIRNNNIITEDKELAYFNPRFFEAIKEKATKLIADYVGTLDTTDPDVLKACQEYIKITLDIKHSADGDKTIISDELIKALAKKTILSVMMRNTRQNLPVDVLPQIN